MVDQTADETETCPVLFLLKDELKRLVFPDEGSDLQSETMFPVWSAQNFPPALG